MKKCKVTKFDKIDRSSSEVSDYYQEFGYVIIRNLISEGQIDTFLKNMDRLLNRKIPAIWHTQDTHRYIPLRKNSDGLLENSLQNPHALCWSGALRKSVANIVANKFVSDQLENISGKSSFSLWQTMYFDKSTGTVGHQDSYYLDTSPGGSLIGAWFALENIEASSGPFWIIPKSHRELIYENKESIERYSDHNEYIDAMSRYLRDKKHGKDIKLALLEKGDCLFWHPFLVHGALDNSNPLLSRKSLTAHYYPSNSELRFHGRGLSTVEVDRLPIRLVGYPSKMARLKMIGKSYVNLAKQSFNNEAILDMRSSSYRK